MSVVEAPAARPRLTPLRALRDERLAELSGDGDRAAFSTIHDRYHAPLYRYCLSLLGNPDDARDALQTTLLAAWRGLGSRRLEGALRPWLYRIAHNASISILRKRRSVAALDEADLPAVDGPERAVATRERLGELLRDLRTLSARQRSALLMRELGDLPYEEIAATFAISPAAARQAVFEARSALFAMTAGRADPCDDVRRAISDGDRRVARGRRVRGHLGECESCQAFADGLRSRRRVLALLPAPPAAALAVALPSLFGGGAAAGGAAGGFGGAAVLGGGSVLKGAAVAAGLLAAGVGAVGGGHLLTRHAKPAAPPVAQTLRHHHARLVAAPPAPALPARKPATAGDAHHAAAHHASRKVVLVARAAPAPVRTSAPTHHWHSSTATPKPQPAASAPASPAPETTPAPAKTPTPTAPANPVVTAVHNAVTQAQTIAATQLQTARQEVSAALALAQQQMQAATQPWATLLARLRSGGR